jgi:outer membrane protein OmpA-like peptidoglycan-associated protein
MRTLASLTLVAAAALAACSTPPANNTLLDAARAEYTAAANNPQVRDGAAVELTRANEALNRADAAFAAREDITTVDHLAYLARQRVALAQQTGERKAAEKAVTEAAAARDAMRLAARTREADAAQGNAVAAQRDAQASQRDAQSAQRDAQAAQAAAMAAQRQSEASQQAASDAQRRTMALEAQLRELNAKKTDRGMVITIGDVLFDTGRAELKPGGRRNIEKLVGFLKEYPERKAVIEGFTDSVGSDASNQALSGRRADAVRGALLSMGVAAERVSSVGYGESYPVADNDSAPGRQMNRRVEIVLSDESGKVPPR